MYIAEISEPGGQISPRPQNREIVNTKLASLNSHRESLVLVFFSVPRVMRGLVGVG